MALATHEVALRHRVLSLLDVGTDCIGRQHPGHHQQVTNSIALLADQVGGGPVVVQLEYLLAGVAGD